MDSDEISSVGQVELSVPSLGTVTGLSSIMYSYGVLRHKLPAAHQKAGDLMVEGWVKFANGEEPWESFSRNDG
jgi:hypothetical protein